jgi:hypothetical protein
MVNIYSPVGLVETFQRDVVYEAKCAVQQTAERRLLQIASTPLYCLKYLFCTIFEEYFYHVKCKIYASLTGQSIRNAENIKGFLIISVKFDRMMYILHKFVKS